MRDNRSHRDVTYLLHSLCEILEGSMGRLSHNSSGPWYNPTIDCVGIIQPNWAWLRRLKDLMPEPTSEPDVVNLNSTITSSINDVWDNICYCRR